MGIRKRWNNSSNLDLHRAVRDDGDDLPLLARAMSLLISRKRFKELDTDGVICESKEGENFRMLCNWMMILCFSLSGFGGKRRTIKVGVGKKLNPTESNRINRTETDSNQLKSISNHWIDDFPNSDRKTYVFL